MKKISIIISFCLIICQSIIAQNMHRAITINNYLNAVEYRNKTIVMKNNASGNSEYYILSSFRIPGTAEKFRLAFIHLSNTFAIIDTKVYSDNAKDLYVNDMIVDPNGNFAFCGKVVENGVTTGMIGQIVNSTGVLNFKTASDMEVQSIGYIQNATGFFYHYSGKYQNAQMFGRSSNNLVSQLTKYIPTSPAIFTDNANFTGVSTTDNRFILVGTTGNNIISIFSNNVALGFPYYKGLTLPTGYTLEGDAVICKISTNDFALAVGIRNNQAPTSTIGFVLVKMNFNCLNNVSTMSVTDQKIYIFGPDKFLLSDICYNPNEQKICVSGRLIRSEIGRPFIAKINATNLSVANARYFAYGFTDNNTQGYELNKIIYNPNALSIVSAGHIKEYTQYQNAAVYVIEGYQSPAWENSTCGDENLLFTSILPCSMALQPGSGSPLNATVFSGGNPINPLDVNGISTSKCVGVNAYSVLKPIIKIADQITDQPVAIINRSNNSLEITGVESGSEYRIYSVAGNMVAKGRINSEEIVSYDYLQSGMYIIAVSNNNTLLKTFKFIRL